MLYNYITDFLVYCKEHNFSQSSISTFSCRLNEFDHFLQSIKLPSLKNISYTHLSDYVISGKSSEHIRKTRVWTLHQFFQYQKSTGVFSENIAMNIPYPKIAIKDPDYLSVKDLNSVIKHFICRAEKSDGKRDLVIVLLFAFLGLRLGTVLALNIQDIDLKRSSIRVCEKGGKIRTLPLPQVICSFLFPYLKDMDLDLGPLFLSKRNTRISARVIQYLFKQTTELLGIHLHSHLFRHTAATHMNQVAGIDVTKQILGHRRRESTERYIHLNPDVYAEYMGRHPYMTSIDEEV